MIVRVLDSAYISDFIDAGFSGNEIRSVVKNYAEKFSNKVVNEKLNDWDVTFRFRYNHVKQILIYLKERSYPLEKYKEITIHIPIPEKGNVPWGVDLEQYLYKDENYLNELMKNFHCLDVDYLAFNNRQDYMIDCMCRAVKYCFTEGFTINGIKVKLK